MTVFRSKEIYRGAEGHIVRVDSPLSTEYRAVTAVGSYSRIYASRQGALKFLRRYEAKRQRDAAKLAQIEALLRLKAL